MQQGKAVGRSSEVAGGDGFVTINVYNVAGQLVSNLVSTNMNAGYHTVSWDAGNVASGLYIVRVVTDSNIASQKVMLLK